MTMDTDMKTAAQDLTGEVKDRMADTAGEVSNAARAALTTTSSRLKASAQDAASALSDAAGELSHKVGDEITRRAGEVRDVISDQGERLSESLHDIAERHDLASLPSRAVETAVDAVSSVANRVTNTPLSSMLDDASDFARRHPVTTAVGVAAAAFVVARLLRSSAPEARGPGMTAHRAEGSSASPAPASKSGRSGSARKQSAPRSRRPAAGPAQA
jgi:gas vesicle protein